MELIGDRPDEPATKQTPAELDVYRRQKITAEAAYAAQPGVYLISNWMTFSFSVCFWMLAL